MFEKFSTPKELLPSDSRFGSGPSLVPVEFLENLAKTGTSLLGTSHRKPAVKGLVKEMQDGLVHFFNIPDDYLVVVGNGGATFLFDMISLGMVEKSSTHFTCGEFSNKWFKAADKVPWINAQEINSEYGNGIEARNAEESDFIAVTLNETSTGVQNTKLPVVDADTILAVDATSGAGQIECDISKTDMFFFSPQKVFASEGGLYICIMSPKAMKRAKKISEDSSRYIPDIMNWNNAIDNSFKNQTYNTPSIGTIFLLNEQVKRMNENGFEAAKAYAKKKADLIYSWAEDKAYLSAFVKNTDYRSHAVACIDVDDKYVTTDLIKVFEKEGSINGIDAYRKLGRNQFRIAMFHNISYEDLEKLTKIISLAIESE